MAFVQTTNAQEGHGGVLKIVSGTYTSTSVTGGDIYTGLSVCLSLILQPKDSSVSANQPVVNETLPRSTDGQTVVTANGETGTWIAIGL
jgi:hypothetical protein